MYEGTWKPNRRSVVTTSPDMVVFLNGEPVLPSKAHPNREIDIQPLVESVSVSLDKDSPPGTANISMSVPRHYREDFFVGGRSIFTFGMEVQIYMKGHFLVGGAPRYYPVFWGLVTSVGENWSGGEQTVSLSCQDILWWWQNQHININPAYNFAQQSDTVEMNLKGNYFAGMNPFNIVYTLSRHVYGDSLNANRFLDQVQSEVTEEQRLAMNAYWTKKWGRITHALKMFGTNAEVIQGDLLSAARRTNPKPFRGRDSSVDNLETEKREPFEFGESNLLDIAPFNISAGSSQIDIYSSEFMSKLEVANTVADAIEYEFFMDSTGEIIFKPPFWNLDVRPNEPVSWIREIDVISQSFSENPPEFTYLEGEGSFISNLELSVDSEVLPKAVYVDYELVRKYGWRPGNFSSEWIGAKKDGGGAKAMFFHLVNKMDEQRASIYEGSVSIPLRPELRLGYPVFLPHKDAYYYVKSISHNFTWGGQCTTDVTLEARRSRFYAPFKSWSFDATPPEPGDTASTDDIVTNLGLRPNDAETGQPVGDENVIMAALDEDQGRRKEDDSVETFERERVGQELKTRRLVSLRSQFGLESPARNYVYQIDPDKGDPENELVQLEGERVTVIDDSGQPRRVNAGRFPISDSRGYELVGVHQYGRNARVTPGDVVVDPDGSQDRAERLVFMRPDGGNPDGQVPEADSDRAGSPATNTSGVHRQPGPQVHPVNYGRRLVELTPPNVGSDLITTARGIVDREADLDGGNESIIGQPTNPNTGSSGASVGTTGASFTVGPYGSVEARGYRFEEDVANKHGQIRSVRERVIGSDGEDKYPDSFVMSFMHVETRGNAAARRRTEDGSYSQYCGPLQIGNVNASESDPDEVGRGAVGDQTRSNEDFCPARVGGTAGVGRSPQEQDRIATERSLEHFYGVQEKYDHVHEYNQKAMIIGWHQGIGVAEDYMDEVVNGDKPEDQWLDERGEQGDKIRSYTEGLTRAQSEIWDPAIQASGTPDSQRTVREAETEPVTGTGEGGEMTFTAEEAERLESQRPDVAPDDQLEEALAEQQNDLRDRLAMRLDPVYNRTSLPSDVPIPRDQRTIDVVTDFLKDLHRRAFEEGREEERELRGETRREPSPPDINSVPTQPQRESDRPPPSLLDRPEVQRFLDEGGSLEELFAPGGPAEDLEEAADDFQSTLDD